MSLVREALIIGFTGPVYSGCSKIAVEILANDGTFKEYDFKYYSLSKTLRDLVSVLITPSQKFSLHAFEMKINDWRKALAQAYRYRYFADSSCVVLPPDEAMRAKKSLSIFRSVNVGLLSFDKRKSCIDGLYSPRKGKPLSANAYIKAIDLLSEQLNFCQSFK